MICCNHSVSLQKLLFVPFCFLFLFLTKRDRIRNKFWTLCFFSPLIFLLSLIMRSPGTSFSGLLFCLPDLENLSSHPLVTPKCPVVSFRYSLFLFPSVISWKPVVEVLVDSLGILNVSVFAMLLLIRIIIRTFGC